MTLASIISEISDIKALCGPSQGELLHGLVQTLSNDAFICEIGCYMGWVTSLLAKSCNGSNKRVIMIDHMLGGICDYPEGIKSQYIEIVDSFISHDVWNKIIPFPCKSDQALPAINLLNPRIELLWVDGDHNYEPFMRDLENYSKFIPVGGYICGDDCTTSVQGSFSELWTKNDRGVFAEDTLGVPQAVWDFFRGNERFEVLPNVHNSLFGFRRVF